MTYRELSQGIRLARTLVTVIMINVWGEKKVCVCLYVKIHLCLFSQYE